MRETIFSYETANGIKADETGTLVKSNDPENGEVIEAEGGYSYTGPEGVPVNIRYIATANGGFVATGDAIPNWVRLLVLSGCPVANPSTRYQGTVGTYMVRMDPER
uniref:Uncharacterized protein n=1 Tax=Timema genevievae TaxID=629358 RepID=A0A7R9K3Z9_TIMGE|nr:unnamed protein product [Timema genevievae]